MTLICRRLVNGDITGGHGLANFCAGNEAVAQTVKCELRFQLGEWFLDSSKGIPWVRNSNVGDRPILGTFPADLAYAEQLIKAAILRVEGVSKLTSFSLDFNHSTRAATCRATLLLVDGTSITLSEGIL